MCWRQQHPEGDNTVEPVDPRAELLAEELHKLVADFQANGNSRGLGDPTAGAWFEAAQQVLDVIAGWTDTAGSES